MDTYFFDNPPKAIMKASFLLVTYIGSILFKQFQINIILPTVLVYFLGNMADYAELAFMRKDKVKKIRDWALWIFLAMVFIAIITFCIFTTDNTSVHDFVNRFYYLFYILCIGVWGIPLVDGVRGQFDEIRKSSKIVEQQIQSGRAFQVMHEGTASMQQK